MTREEEIMKAARVYADGIAQHLPNKKYCEEDFIAGVKWADRKMIEKVCEWLRTNLCEHYADEPIAHKMGRPISGYISFFEEPPVGVIANFRKAMESSSSEIPNNCEKGGEE